MRRKNRTTKLRHLLSFLLCLFALTAGGIFSLWNTRGARSPLSAPAPSKRPVGSSEVAAPMTEPTADPAPDSERQPDEAPRSDFAPSVRSPSSRRPQTAPIPQAIPPDLSAYRPQARRAQGESYLPQDRSLSAGQLEGHLAPKAASDDEVPGLIGDIARGAQKILKSVDDATLDASRRALGDIARPEKAKIRPYEDGARLHIDIPAHTVDLRRKK